MDILNTGPRSCLRSREFFRPRCLYAVLQKNSSNRQAKRTILQTKGQGTLITIPGNFAADLASTLTQRLHLDNAYFISPLILEIVTWSR